MCYANRLYMMSVLHIHLENISVPSGVVLQMKFYCNMCMLNCLCLNCIFCLSLFYIFLNCVHVTLFFSCVTSVLLPCGEIKFTISPIFNENEVGITEFTYRDRDRTDLLQLGCKCISMLVVWY